MQDRVQLADPLDDPVFAAFGRDGDDAVTLVQVFDRDRAAGGRNLRAFSEAGHDGNVSAAIIVAEHREVA